MDSDSRLQSVISGNWCDWKRPGLVTSPSPIRCISIHHATGLHRPQWPYRYGPGLGGGWGGAARADECRPVARYYQRRGVKSGNLLDIP